MTPAGYIGIDIGGTNAKIAWIEADGRWFHLERVYTRDVKPEPEDFAAHIWDKVQSILERVGQHPLGVGLCSPGLQMPNGSGTLFSVNLPFLNRFPLKAYFVERLGVPGVTMNDLVAHSLGEYRFGAGKGVDRFLSVSLGTGLGHTFIESGRPVLTPNGVSGDSARMILEVDSPVSDSSGVFGSAEGLCGVHGIEYLIQERAAPYVNAQALITAARERSEPQAQDILAVIARRLALLLVNLAAVYLPDRIAVTGGQTEAGPFFMEACRSEFARLSGSFFRDYFHMTGRGGDVEIVKAEAGGLAGLLGTIVPLLSEG